MQLMQGKCGWLKRNRVRMQVGNWQIKKETIALCSRSNRPAIHKLEYPSIMDKQIKQLSDRKIFPFAV